jgi:hypothetical protein
MKNTLLPFALVAALLASCTQERYATKGKSYENDEVYIQPGDTYISDFALVDNEPDANNNQAQYPDSMQSEDDYYSGNTINNGSLEDQFNGNGVTNNYYGNVYQNNYGNGINNPYGYGFGNNGFGNNAMLIWNPYSGWRLRYNWGFGYNCFGGFGGYGCGYGWNTPWYDPWYGSGWCSNNWYNGYGFYDPWGWNSPYYGYNNWYGNNYFYGNNNWNNNDNNNGGGIVYGPRPSISVGSSVNSSYDGGSIGLMSANKPGLVNGIDPTAKPVYSKPLQKPTETVAAVSDKPTIQKQPDASFTDAPALQKPTDAISPAGAFTNSVAPASVPAENTAATKPAVVNTTDNAALTANEKPVTASNNNSDYFTMPRPQAGASKPSYVNSKPSSANNNAPMIKPSTATSPSVYTTPGAKPAQSNTAPARNSGGYEYERTNTAPSRNNTTPARTTAPARSNTAPARTNTEPARNNNNTTKPNTQRPPADTKPAMRPPQNDSKPSAPARNNNSVSPSKPSGGSVSPSRPSGGGGGGGSVSPSRPSGGGGTTTPRRK